MKKIILLLAGTVLFNLQVSAQAPNKFNYQGVARSATGSALANQTLGVKISILDGNNASAAVLYSETQSVTTNASGLYHLAIGGGTKILGTLGSIDWGIGDRFIKVEMDPAGGSSYVDLGTTQLLSVPYALYSMNGKIGPKGDKGDTGPQGPKGDPGSGSTSGWSLTGNAATTDANFIGTTDNKPLTVKVNNSIAGYVGPVSSNTSWGFGALSSLSAKANKNTAIGTNALYANKEGQGSVAIGLNALTSYLGYENVAVGNDALGNQTDGAHNVAIGNSAMSQSLKSEANISIGAYSMMGNTNGSGNISIGTKTDMSPYKGKPNNNSIGIGMGNSVSGSNSIAIGAEANVSGDNIIHFGNSSVTEIRGQVNFSTYSDRRIKTNIKNNVPGLAFINKLRPVTYNLDIHTQNELLGVNTPDFDGKYNIEKILQTGFIAQEVAAAAQQVAYDFNGVIKPKNDQDLYKVSYAEFVVPLVKAVQEQQQQIELQQQQIKNQQEFNEKLQLLLNQQQLRIDQQDLNIKSMQTQLSLKK